MRRQQPTRAALVGRRPRVGRIRPGALPGTLDAVESAESPVIHVMRFNHESVQEERVTTIDAALAGLMPGAVTWINIDGLGDPTVFARPRRRGPPAARSWTNRSARSWAPSGS